MLHVNFSETYFIQCGFQYVDSCKPKKNTFIANLKNIEFQTVLVVACEFYTFLLVYKLSAFSVDYWH